MNFEDAKAEIFRRGNARIAAKKRKKRILLGAAIPVLLVALLAFPVSRLLRGSAKEKAPALLMENQDAIAPGSTPAPGTTFPENRPESNPQSCGSSVLNEDPAKTSLDISYILPPDVYLHSAEGEKLQPMQSGYCWIQITHGQEVTSVAESPDILQPGVVDRQITTNCDYLLLDASNYVPQNVEARYWSTSVIGIESYYTSNGSAASIYSDEGNDQELLSNSFTLSSNLYRLELVPGENIYELEIQWPNGTVFCCFRVNYEE